MALQCGQATLSSGCPIATVRLSELPRIASQTIPFHLLAGQGEEVEDGRNKGGDSFVEFLHVFWLFNEVWICPPDSFSHIDVSKPWLSG